MAGTELHTRQACSDGTAQVLLQIRRERRGRWRAREECVIEERQSWVNEHLITYPLIIPNRTEIPKQKFGRVCFTSMILRAAAKGIGLPGTTAHCSCKAEGQRHSLQGGPAAPRARQGRRTCAREGQRRHMGQGRQKHMGQPCSIVDGARGTSSQVDGARGTPSQVGQVRHAGGVVQGHGMSRP